MRWKRILAITALLIITLIVAVYIILVNVDFNRFKPLIAQAVQNATGRTLNIKGDIKVELGLTLAVSAEDITFQNEPWGSRQELARIKRFETKLALLPLMMRHIKIEQLNLVEPDILIETDKSGASNIQFKTSEKRKGKPPAVIIDDIQIKKGHLVYKNYHSGKTYALRIDHLIVNAFDSPYPLDLELKGAFNDHPFEINGSFDRLMPSITSGQPLQVKLEAQTKNTIVTLAGEVGDVINAKDVAFNVYAKGHSIYDILKFIGIPGVPDPGPFQLVAAVTGSKEHLTATELNFNAGTGDSPFVRINGSVGNLLAWQDVELNFIFQGKNETILEKFTGQPMPFNGAFSVSGRYTHPAAKILRFNDLKAVVGKNEIIGRIELDFYDQQPRLAAELSSPRLNLNPLKALHFDGLQHLATIPNLGPVELNATVADLAGSFTIMDMDLRAGTQNLAEVSITGTVRELFKLKGVNLGFRIQGKNTAKLEEITGLTLPFNGKFLASGQFTDPENRFYKVSDLQISVGENDVNGWIGLNLAAKRPFVTAELTCPTLNLQPIFKPSRKKTSNVDQFTSAPKKQPNHFAHAPGSQFALADANIKINTGQVLLPQLTFNDASVSFTLEDGKIAVDVKGPALPDTTDFIGVAGLPALGPYELTFTAPFPSKTLSVEKFSLRTGTEKLATLRISGSIHDLVERRGIDLHFAFQGKNLSKLKKMIGNPLPSEAPFFVSGRFTDTAARNYTFSDLNLVVGNSDLTGTMDLKFSGPRPNVTIALLSEKIDLRPVFSGAIRKDTQKEPATVLRKKKRKWLQVKARILDALQAADVRLKMQAGEIQMPQAKINGFNLTFKLNDGLIVVIAESHSAPDVPQINEIPDLGPFRLIIEAEAYDNMLRVDEWVLFAGTEDLIDIEFSGTAGDLLTFDDIFVGFAIRGKDSMVLERMTGHDIPTRGAFFAAGQIANPEDKFYKFSNLKLVLGQNDLGGSVTLDLRGQRPAMTAMLSSQNIDLRPFLLDLYEKGANNNPSTKARTNHEKIFSPEPLPLNLLTLADLRIQVQGQRIFTTLLEIRDLKFDILLEDGHLEVKPFKFNTKEGSVESSIDILSQENAAAIVMRLEINHIELGSTIKEFATDSVIEGEFAAEMELSGYGESISEIMSALDGEITTMMSGVRIKNKYVGYGFLDANLRSTLIQLMNPFSQKKPFTEFNCLVKHWDIEHGLATWNGFSDTDQATVLSHGKVDLNTERLKGGLKPYPKKGYGFKKLGKISFSFSELARPLNIGGTLANPTLVIDTSETAMTMGKAAGGIALFGPFGIAAAFTSITPFEDNPCFAAIQASEEEDLDAIDGKPETEKSFLEKIVAGIKKAFEHIGDTIKKPFVK
jgi:uncharacterized protein involved in outer membrane biogenesis